MQLVKVFGLALACATLPLASAAAATHADPSSSSPAVAESAAAAGLTQEMRRLWTEHVVWTRDYIVAAVGDQPDAPAAAARLMRNQDDIGKAVAGFYGDAAGRQLTALLKQHISIAVDLIKAAKGGDQAGQQAAAAKWQENGVQIADFLSKANPNWPRATLVSMMKTHLSTTTDEVVARLTKHWDDDVRAYDAVYTHILMMADALSAGIVKQFPQKFGD